jgi:hypothetical protein
MSDASPLGACLADLAGHIDTLKQQHQTLRAALGQRDDETIEALMHSLPERIDALIQCEIRRKQLIGADDGETPEHMTRKLDTCGDPQARAHWQHVLESLPELRELQFHNQIMLTRMGNVIRGSLDALYGAAATTYTPGGETGRGSRNLGSA